MKKAKLRPHHIICMRFLRLEFPERGEGFRQVLQGIKDILQKEDDVLLEMNEGVDELCSVCNNCQDNRCQSPKGDEEAVRKWDHILLKGLRSSYGEARTAKQWRNLIEQEGPLDFCQTRCPKKLDCSIFSVCADSMRT
jgi:hypothetical protein